MASGFATPQDAALTDAGKFTHRVEIVWSDEEGDWAAVVGHEAGPERQEHVFFCQQTPSGWVLRACDPQNNYYAYDGSTPPWNRDTNNPVGCWVHRRWAGEGVVAVRVGSNDEAVEQPVVDGRWYVANFEVRQWGPSRPWTPLTAIRLQDLSWTRPVTDRLAMTEDAYVHQSIDAMQRGEAADHLMMTVMVGDPEVSWRLLERVVAEAPDDLLPLLGAGDVETFFRDHGEEYWDRIEDRARRDSKMARALSGVWAYDAPKREALDRLLVELGVTQDEEE